MFARFECCQDHIGMKVVTCCDQYHVNSIIRKYLFVIRRRIVGSELLCNRFGIGSRATHHGTQLVEIAELLDVRQVHPLGKPARTNECDLYSIFSEWMCGDCDDICGFLLFLWIGEKHHERFRRCCFQRLVCRVRLLHGIDLRYHIHHMEFLRRHEIQHFLQVTILRPTHIADRVFQSLLLVDTVITPRTIGCGDEKIYLLLVEICTVQMQPDIADKDNTPLATAHLKRRRDDRVGLCRRRDNYSICTDPIRQMRYLLGIRRAIRLNGVVRSMRQRHLNATGIQIADDNLAATGLEHLHGKLSDNTKADDDETLAERRMGTTNSLHGNRAESNGTRLLERDPLRNLDEEIARHIDDLRMVCALGPGTGDVLANFHITYASTDADHYTCGRVSNWRSRFEFALDELTCLGNALFGNHIKDFLYLIAFLECAFPERNSTCSHSTHLRTNGDTRIDNTYEHLV